MTADEARVAHLTQICRRVTRSMSGVRMMRIAALLSRVTSNVTKRLTSPLGSRYDQMLTACGDSKRDCQERIFGLNGLVIPDPLIMRPAVIFVAVLRLLAEVRGGRPLPGQEARGIDVAQVHRRLLTVSGVGITATAADEARVVHLAQVRRRVAMTCVRDILIHDSSPEMPMVLPERMPLTGSGSISTSSSWHDVPSGHPAEVAP
jgi:hypothetical protein